MRVIALSALKRFCESRKHADAREPLLAWYRHALKADWSAPAEVKRDYGTASILRVVYVRFVGTHAQYDRIDAQTV